MSLLLSRQTTQNTPFSCKPRALHGKEPWEAQLRFSLPQSPWQRQNESSSRLVARPGPPSQLLRQADTICSSLNIRQLAASFLPAFLRTCVASGKALRHPELLVALSLWGENICLTCGCSGLGSLLHVQCGAQCTCYHTSLLSFLLPAHSPLGFPFVSCSVWRQL